MSEIHSHNFVSPRTVAEAEERLAGLKLAITRIEGEIAIRRPEDGASDEDKRLFRDWYRRATYARNKKKQELIFLGYWIREYDYERNYRAAYDIEGVESTIDPHDLLRAVVSLLAKAHKREKLADFPQAELILNACHAYLRHVPVVLDTERGAA